MSRVASKALKALIDVAVLAAAWVGAFLLRFDWSIPSAHIQRCVTLLPYIVLLQYGFLHSFGVPRFPWRYIGLREASRIFFALGSASVVLIAIRLATPTLSSHFRVLSLVWAPIGTVGIDFVLALLGITGARVLHRQFAERGSKRRRGDAAEPGIPTMLIGAGAAGLALAKEIESRPDLRVRAVGFLDDDLHKVGSVLHGIPVLGTTAQLAELCAQHAAEQAIITIAGASGKQVRRILRLCEEASIPVRIVPSLSEIVGGKVNLSRLRNVAIEDLLRREPVQLDESAIRADVNGAVVFVTGAGGSIGSELCRQLCRFEPGRLVLVERSENALFEIHRELVASFPHVEVVPALADICDELRMRTLFRKHRPRLLLHAAAHKHVPMMEWNPGEAIKNNVLGTKLVADLASEFEVAQFVMISTDKAVNPTSVMGATKRLAELYVQASTTRSKTRFNAVRFGNVLGSAGSVIPIFRSQIANGGPVTVTHPDMRRYFMTIPEASQLVLQAATMGKGGEIFILDMGEPIRIVDLAEDLIRLSGLRPGEDIDIAYSGVRPGEKLVEELSIADENADKTYHPKVFVGRLRNVTYESATALIAEARRLLDGREDLIAEKIESLLPEFRRPASSDAPSVRPPLAAEALTPGT